MFVEAFQWGFFTFWRLFLDTIFYYAQNLEHLLEQPLLSFVFYIKYLINSLYSRCWVLHIRSVVFIDHLDQNWHVSDQFVSLKAKVQTPAFVGRLNAGKGFTSGNTLQEHLAPYRTRHLHAASSFFKRTKPLFPSSLLGIIGNCKALTHILQTHREPQVVVLFSVHQANCENTVIVLLLRSQDVYKDDLQEPSLPISMMLEWNI